MDKCFLIPALLMLPMSFRDIREREVTVGELAAFFSVEFLISVMDIFAGKNEIEKMAAGLIPGLFLWILSKAFGMFGEADAWVMAGLGMHLGLFRAIFILMAGLISAAVINLLALLFKRLSATDRVPFIPYINAGIVSVGLLLG